MKRNFFVIALFVFASASVWASAVPSQCEDVMLQGFYWNSYHVDEEDYPTTIYGDTRWETLFYQAEEIGSYFDLVWLPPSAYAEGMGYHPKQYSNQNSNWGTRAELDVLISALHSAGSKVIADIVINHIEGENGWCDFMRQDFGEYGVFEPDASWICNTDEMNDPANKKEAGDCYGTAIGKPDDGYGPEANYGAARDWAHDQENVQEMFRAYAKWLINVMHYDGFRYDYCKGFHASHIDDYNEAGGAYMSFMELWSGNDDIIRNINDAKMNTMALDFQTKYSAFDGIAGFDYSRCQGSGLLGAGYSKYAVTFVENHDWFYRDNGQEFGGNGKSMTPELRDRLLQANAFLLSMPGIPCVFYPHWVKYKDYIKPMIMARKLAGVHSESAVIDESADYEGYRCTIVGKSGNLILCLGNRAGIIDYSSYGYTKIAYGNGYEMWTDAEGSSNWDTFTSWYIKLPFAEDDWVWHAMNQDENGTWRCVGKWNGGGATLYTRMEDSEESIYIADNEMTFLGDTENLPFGVTCIFEWNPTANKLQVTPLVVSASSNNNDWGEVNVKYSYPVATLTALPNVGYKFVKWADDNTDNPRKVSLSTTQQSYTAVFEKETFTITTTANNDDWGSCTGGNTAVYGASLNLTATPNYGYHFGYWDNGSMMFNDNPLNIVVEGDATYTAVFVKNVYHISLETNGTQGYIEGPSEAEYLDNVVITAASNNGYHFSQWSDGITDNPRTFVLMQDTTFTALFAVNQYNIFVASSDNTKGSVTGGGTYDYGSVAMLTATAQTGYQFNGWNDGSTENPHYVAVLGDASYVAYFDTKMCQLVVKPNDILGGAVTGSGTYAYGTQVTVTASENSGYQFLKWSNGATYNPYKFTIVDDVQLIGFFQQTQAEVVEVEEVTVTPEDNSANIQWPQVDDAYTYTLIIWADAEHTEKVCTLTFDASGRLTNIDFSKKANRSAYAQEAQVAGFSFTVTGLDEDTEYFYELEAADEDGTTISTETGEFRTTKNDPMAIIQTEEQFMPRKLLQNGHLYILRDGVIYNTQGARVE